MIDEWLLNHPRVDLFLLLHGPRPYRRRRLAYIEAETARLIALRPILEAEVTVRQAELAILKGEAQ